MARTNESTLKDAINQFMKDYGLQDRYLQSRVLTEWPKIMGPTIAKHTTDIYVKKDVLIVYVDSAPLKQELTLSKSKMIERINESLETNIINDIQIR